MGVSVEGLVDKRACGANDPHPAAALRRRPSPAFGRGWASALVLLLLLVLVLLLGSCSAVGEGRTSRAAPLQPQRRGALEPSLSSCLVGRLPARRGALRPRPPDTLLLSRRKRSVQENGAPRCGSSVGRPRGPCELGMKQKRLRQHMAQRSRSPDRPQRRGPEKRSESLCDDRRKSGAPAARVDLTRGPLFAVLALSPGRG
jgi:hypothetical protein